MTDDLAGQILHQERKCGRKIIYLDAEEAKTAARKMHKKFKARYSGYRCPYCNAWHVGRDRSREAGLRRSSRMFPHLVGQEGDSVAQ